MKSARPQALEARTARLTILIDPRKKAVFDQLCATEDVTPSQVVRRLIRAYIEQRLGAHWSQRTEADPVSPRVAGTVRSARPARRPAARR
jgi:hypothetical protein